MTETNTTRPTIDEYLAEWFDDDGIEFFKSELADHGYVIVHPDDVRSCIVANMQDGIDDGGWISFSGRTFADQVVEAIFGDADGSS